MNINKNNPALKYTTEISSLSTKSFLVEGFSTADEDILQKYYFI